jgi:hypothetical protein
MSTGIVNRNLIRIYLFVKEINTNQIFVYYTFF